MDEILYKVHNNLYINLTNRCPCACTFCLRQTMDRIGESHSLWLRGEPDLAAVKAAFAAQDMSACDEVVFCGFGEPTERFELLKEVARFVRETYQKPIRLDTNGLGDLINGRSIAPELAGLVDTVSISLNTPNREAYLALVRPRFGAAAYDALLEFARQCVRFVPRVVLTTVATTLSAEEEAECAAICEKIGTTYRIRAWEGKA